MEVREERLGNVYDNDRFTGGNFGGNVWGSNGIAPTMKTGASASQQCVVDIKKVGFIDKGNGQHESNEVVDSSGLCPTICAGHGVKYWVNHVEVRKMEKNIIVDDLYESREPRVYEQVSPTMRSERYGLKTIKIRQATKDGFIDCEIPGVADLNYPTSSTRRGRVVGGGKISPTLTTENIPSVIDFGNPDFYNFLYEIDGDIYLIRIRKLIPRECLRLMDVDDDVIDRMHEVESNVNLYKAAGNSIVTNCLTAIFGAMYSEESIRNKYVERANASLTVY